MRRLDEKLARIVDGGADPQDFIIADAKDADMGFGVIAPGPDGRGGHRPLADYLAQIRDILARDLVDVMLLSASSLERLTEDGAFRNATATPAVRANDATDIWNNRHGSYRSSPSRPFRSASLAPARGFGCDLCLYSMTFCDEIDADVATLEAFAAFRRDAEAAGMRYFLEMFNPNAGRAAGLDAAQTGRFVNDCIVRSLAGLTRTERPRFLKVAYNGPAAMEELAAYDPSIVVGVMGGAAGTSRDAFELIGQSARHGARVALFGRKINLAEAPLEIIAHLRRVAEGDMTPADAVNSYHAALKRLGVAPARALEDDLKITEDALRAAAV